MNSLGLYDQFVEIGLFFESNFIALKETLHFHTHITIWADRMFNFNRIGFAGVSNFGKISHSYEGLSLKNIIHRSYSTTNLATYNVCLESRYPRRDDCDYIR